MIFTVMLVLSTMFTSYSNQKFFSLKFKVTYDLSLYFSFNTIYIAIIFKARNIFHIKVENKRGLFFLKEN